MNIKKLYEDLDTLAKETTDVVEGFAASGDLSVLSSRLADIREWCANIESAVDQTIVALGELPS